MKTTHYSLFKLLCVTLLLPYLGFAQSTTESVPFEVNRVYPYISITKSTLLEAQTLLDINPRYKPSWVKEYYAVEITTTQQGQLKQAIGKDNQLTAAQKALMANADAGADIQVVIRYLPDNNLVHNEAKEAHFTLSIDPATSASYPGGITPLNQYLREHAIDHIPAGTFTGYDLAAVQFTVSTEGEIVAAQIVESTKDAAVDNLLLEAICTMPYWQPATYTNGTTVAQQFVLTVGNIENCMVNLLSIKPNGQE